MHDEQKSGADGWVDARELSEPQLAEHPHRPPMVVERTTPSAQERSSSVADEVDAGKLLAILSHASVLFGLPVFLIPMFVRDNRFALHHAKAAAVTFTFFWIAAGFTVVSCGIFFPVMMLAYIPALVGLVQASNGRLAGPWGFGGAGEQIFRTLKVGDGER